MVIIFPILVLISLGLIFLMFASYWRLYEKAGRQGWEGIIPFYNTYIMLEIIGRPTYWLFLLFVPILNIFIAFRMLDLFVKGFGKDSIFAVACILLPIIFIPSLAFSEAEFDPLIIEENTLYGENEDDFV